VELYRHSPTTPSWRGARLKHRNNLISSWMQFWFVTVIPKYLNHQLQPQPERRRLENIKFRKSNIDKQTTVVENYNLDSLRCRMRNTKYTGSRALIWNSCSHGASCSLNYSFGDRVACRDRYLHGKSWNYLIPEAPVVTPWP